MHRASLRFEPSSRDSFDPKIGNISRQELRDIVAVNQALQNPDTKGWCLDQLDGGRETVIMLRKKPEEFQNAMLSARGSI